MTHILTTIGEACQVGDGTHSKIARQDSGVMYLTARNLKDGRLDVSKLYFISEQDYIKCFLGRGRALVKPEKGDLIFSIIGSLGEPYLVAEKDHFGISSSVAIVRPDATRLDSRFLLYWAKGPTFQNALNGIRGGVAQGYVSLEMIRSLPIPCIKLDIQERIAGVLSAYDELIENNQRRIRILEEMARSLYREWFVHFRYPGHEAVPLVPSRLGPIPQGWEIRKVDTVLERHRAGKVYTNSEAGSAAGVPIFDQSTDELMGFHENNADHLATDACPIAIFGDHTCKLHMSYEPFSVGPNVIPFTQAVSAPLSYIFLSIQGLVTTQEYKRHWSLLKAKEVILADLELSKRFDIAIQPNFRFIHQLRKQITNLRQTRDLLLPRLISGQLSLTVEPR